ncbi:MAG: NADH-quinone oxidoreductase subunit L [Melioribacter sp.]|uniref:NADH-quinone oxidoreductase subunit L n=1 Tax=Rosettibacter primus TaxID=3111523 RepID=UPI00247D5671|nr:NADH-quinone oxidoreductase subunit L [Melioribacter sp.]
MTENLLITLSIINLFLPVLGFAILIFFGKRFPKLYLLEVYILFIALIISIFILYSKLTYFNKDIVSSLTWFILNNAPDIGTVNIELGIKIDNITAIMLFVVNLISALVHLYSIEYMRGDKRYTRYFAYLGLFTFSMLGIVLTHNLLMMYIFWELVGLSSYLLIGFWFEKKSAADASKKAFIVNRVGDVGMFIGILILFTNYKTFTFDTIFHQISIGNLPFGSETWLTAAGILVFMGAVGKSAQFPLHVWLPDAMEGPTPVSALIHAATMVAAGVYLVTRIFVMLTADAMLVIAIIGAVTSLVAATIAITQNDIKKVLAYSTVSQLGYMIMSLGVGAYVFAFFHLVTHAFFKACLFLGSGSVIHSMHHEQDIRNMGGLRKKMPVTYITFLISTLAISGIPLTSGFLSKDGILAGTLAFGKLTGHWLIPAIGFTVAALTAFYMFRLLILTFHGEPRDHHKFEHAHESPFVMIAPLIILAALSIFIFYTPNPLSPDDGWFLKNWVKTPEQVTPASTRFDFMKSSSHKENIHGEIIHSVLYTETLHWAHYPAMMLSITVAGLGILLAFMFYQWKKVNIEKLTEKIKPLYNFSLNKWYIDELYDATAVGQTLNFSKVLAWFDNNIIDGIVNGSAWITKSFSKLSGLFDTYVVDGMVNFSAFFSGFVGFSLKKLQTGKVQTYVVFVVFSVIILLLIFKPF